ncbi:MAG: two-component system sensor histidine kinase CreC [Verrucomicrobiales bacterium]
MSIRTRIILSYLIIIGVGFFYLVKKITDVKEIKPRYMESVEDPMVDTAHLLATLIEGDIKEGRIDPARFGESFQRAASRQFVAQIYSKRKTTLDLHVYITDASGIVVFDSDGGRSEGQDYSRRNDVFLTLRGKYGARSTRSNPDDPTSSVLYVAAPIMNGDTIMGVLTVSKPQKSMAVFMEQTRRKIFIMGAVAASLVVVVGSIFSTWLTRPIERLTHYAKAVRDGRRVALPNLGRSEIATLGSAFEEMRDALEGKKYVENYVQALTHEIKSPVAAIRGAAELLDENMPAEERAKFLGNIRAEAIRIQDIVDRLLLLSGVEAKKTLDERKSLDLAGLVNRAVASVESQAGSKQIHLKTIVPSEPCLAEGDEFLLEKAMLNLLQNALAFAPPGGRIATLLRREEGRYVITVEDNGPGIPDYAQPRVFERFFSLPHPDTGKKSSGLGLAFVREVAVLHRGSAALRNSRPDGGAIATLELPSTVVAGV